MGNESEVLAGPSLLVVKATVHDFSHPLHLEFTRLFQAPFLLINTYFGHLVRDL